MQKMQVTYLILQDNMYPYLLKRIKNPPTILYKKGTYLFNKKDILVSIVGTRKITEYGKLVTEKLVTELVSTGCVIVSGLAMGVDALAHGATIGAGGKTIAVLGGGVDFCTPQENNVIYDKILASGGAILSEAPLGQIPNKGAFPRRNRIIAGLSLGVLVTEGDKDSGSLITAHDAFLFGRKVFAVPGPITSSVSQGPNTLIGHGAKMVISGEDILKELNMRCITGTRNITDIKGLNKEEKKIFDLLQNESLHVDEIVRRTKLSPSHIGTVLSLMEVKGLIKSSDNGQFCLLHS